MPECCYPASRWAHVTVQSNENYRTSRQRLRWPTKDLELLYHCDIKNTGTGKNTSFQIKEKRQSFIEIIKWAQNGRKTRLTGYHDTVLRFSRQMGACHNAVKRKLLDITSKITLTNQGSRTIISLWYQEHRDRQKHKFSDKRETAKFHWNH